jgi:hypothetical protein
MVGRHSRTVSFISLFIFPLLFAECAEARDGIHVPFDLLLKEYVHEGAVDYRGLKGNEGALDAYLDVLAGTDPSLLDQGGEIAFWINAYNAFTLKLILNHYPGIESIKDIPSSERWKAEEWKVDGGNYSLDDIEHNILRKMGEPRIHFAIVCASRSCPDLRSEAYTPDRLDEQLALAARGFLANPRKGLRVSEEKGMIWGVNYNVYLSRIFDWFGGDFEKASGSVIDFVVPYATEADSQFMTRHRDELDVKYLDYDWRLNGK